MTADGIACYHDLLASSAALAADSQAALEKARAASRPVHRHAACLLGAAAAFPFAGAVSPPARRRESIAPRVSGDPRSRTRRPRLPPAVPVTGLGEPTAGDRSRLSRSEPHQPVRFLLRFGQRALLHRVRHGVARRAATPMHSRNSFTGCRCFRSSSGGFASGPSPRKPASCTRSTDSFKRWQGNTSDPPRIAILDWREEPTFSEFVLYYDYFKTALDGPKVGIAAEDALEAILAGLGPLYPVPTITWRLDRLGRTAKGLTALFDELVALKVNFVSLKDGIDLGTPGGPSDRQRAGVRGELRDRGSCRAHRRRQGGDQGDEGDHDHEDDDLGGADRRRHAGTGDGNRLGVERVAKRQIASGQKLPGR